MSLNPALTSASLAQVVQGVVGSSQDEDDAVAALGLLAELAECPAALVGSRSLPDMATWCFGLATARNAPLAVRHAAMQVRAGTPHTTFFSFCMDVVCWQPLATSRLLVQSKKHMRAPRPDRLIQLPCECMPCPALPVCRAACYHPGPLAWHVHVHAACQSMLGRRQGDPRPVDLVITHAARNMDVCMQLGTAQLGSSLPVISQHA